METFALFVATAIIGVGVGVLSGMLGIGGGTVMVPLFRLLFGMSAISSTATSLFAIVPTSISGAVSHIRQKTCIPALGIACGLGGALTSPLGVWLATISPSWLVMLAAALVIIYSSINMIRKGLALPSAKEKAAAAPAAAASSAGAAAPAAAPGAASAGAGAAAPGATTSSIAANSSVPPAPAASSPSSAAPTPVPEDIQLTKKQLLIGVCIGLFAGVMSGYVGVGGGFIMVPLMLTLIHIPMRKASGTSLIAVMILAVPGVIEQGVLGNIDYLAGIAIVIGSIPGAVLGAKLVKVIPERTLRLIFGGFLIVAAFLLAVKEFGLLG